MATWRAMKLPAMKYLIHRFPILTRPHLVTDDEVRERIAHVVDPLHPE
jgi:hypothetical protein